jgi:WD40 repeat protein
VRVWDMHTGKSVATLQGHTSWVNAVAISPDGTRIVSGSSDETVRVWDMHTGQSVATLRGHDRPVLTVHFLPDGHSIESKDSSDTTRTWTPGQDFPAPESSISTLAHPTQLSVADSEKIVFEVEPSGWLIANSRRLCWLPFERRRFGQSLAWSGSNVVIGAASGTITILDAAPLLSYFTSLEHI